MKNSNCVTTAGRGLTNGTIEAHAGGAMDCRKLLVLRDNPITKDRLRMRKRMTFWQHYYDLIICP